MKNITYRLTPLTFYHLIIFFFKCDIAQGMVFRGKRSGMIHNFTMDADPGYNYIEKFRGEVQWFMIENKDFLSSISFIFKNENNEIVTFNGQSITFRLSVKRIFFLSNKCQKYLKKSRLQLNRIRQKPNHKLENIQSQLPPILQNFK